MSRAMVIVNPHARSGQAVAEKNAHRDQMTQRLESLAGTVEWCETQYPGHAVALAAEAANSGYSYVLAAGGDGTIHEVLNGIMRAHERPVFGVVPWGSLNDFHKALSEAERPSHNDPATMPLDVGQADFDGVQRYIGLSISIGLASWANQQYQLASQRFGRILGLIPGAFKATVSYHFPRTASISINGAAPRDVPMLSLSINNSPTVGGGARLTPQARINDGQFDMCLIPPMSLLRLGGLLIGSYLGQGIDSRAVTLQELSQITIVSPQPLPVHVDGEMIQEIGSLARRISVSVLPGALRVVRPSLLNP